MGGRYGWVAVALWAASAWGFGGLTLGEPSEVFEVETRALPGPRADVALLLLSGRASGDLTAVSGAVSRLAADGSTGAELWLELERADLETEEGGDALRLELHAYAVRSSEVVASVSRRAYLPWADLDRDHPGALQLKVGGRLALDPGDYELRVLVRESRSQRFVLRVLPLTVGMSDGPAVVLESPAEAAPVAPEPSSGTAVEAAQTAGRGGAAAALIEAYLDVLDSLADGAVETAVSELGELEEQAVGSNQERARTQNQLSSAIERVIERLVRRDPESLLPLVLLHLETYESYLARGIRSPYLTSASRGRLLDLVRTYARQADGDLGPAIAASILADLGAKSDRAGMPESGRGMFDEALALDPDNVTLLLVLGHWYERRGNYREAEPLFRRLVSVDPRSEEGRLRLALCLRRLERGDEALSWLQELTADRPSPWILTIAHQELAQLLIEQGEAAAAVRSLETAVALLPGEQRLHLQLAYALERAGDRRPAREVIARVAALAAAGSRDSPRHLYSRRPGDLRPGDWRGLDGAARPRDGSARAGLRRQAIARLPLLAGILTVERK